MGIRSALTQQQERAAEAGNSGKELPSLGAVKLPTATNSYRYELLSLENTLRERVEDRVGEGERAS